MDVIERLTTGEELFFEYVHSVQDVLYCDPAPVTLDDKVDEVWNRIRGLGLSHLPVIDVEKDRNRKKAPRRIHVGTLGQKELAITLSHFAGSLSQSDQDEKALQKWVGTGNYVKRRLPTAKLDTPLFEAVSMMLQHGLETLAVVDGDTYLGAFTCLDALRCIIVMASIRERRPVQESSNARLFDLLSEGESAQAADVLLGSFMNRVRDVMRPPPPVVRPEDNVETAIQTMEKTGSKYLAVVNRRGQLRGVVDDVAVQLILPSREIDPRQMVDQPSLFYYDTEQRGTQRVLAERVAVAMHGNPRSLSPEDSIVEAARLLSEPNVPAVLVSEGENRPLAGMLLREDLLRMLGALGDLLSRRRAGRV